MIPDIPSTRRNGEPFDDEFHLLSWLIARISAPCRTRVAASGLTIDELAQAETTLGLLRAQIVHARAASRLTKTADREAAYPIVRTMLEIWAEIAYLNEAGLNPDRVWASRLWPLLVMDAARSMPEITASIEAFRETHPAAFEATTRQFKRSKHGHFSGQGRRALVERFCDETSAWYYSFLSMCTHPVMQGSAHAEYANLPNIGEGTIEFFRPAAAADLDIALVAIRSLLDSWRKFFRVFGSRLQVDRRPRARNVAT